MDTKAGGSISRRISRLAAVQLASTVILLSIIAIVAIVHNAQARRAAVRLDERITRLTERLAALESTGALRASGENPDASRATSPPRDPRPAAPPEPAGPEPTAETPRAARRFLDLRRQLGDQLDDPGHADAIAAALRELDGEDAAALSPESALAAAELASAVADHASAARWAMLAAKRESADRPASYLLALSLERLSQFEGALAPAELAAAVPGASPRRRLLLARVQHGAARNDEAIASLAPLIAEPPSTLSADFLSEACVLAAEIALARGDPAAARAFLGKLPPGAADTAGATRPAARIELAEGRAEQALVKAQRVLSSLPDDTTMLGVSGVALLKLNRMDEALTALRRRAELAPGDAAAHEDLGLALLTRLQPLEAATCFERATSLAPAQASAWYYLAIARINADDDPLALAALDTVVKHDPQFARAHFLRAACLARRGNSDAAGLALATAVSLDGTLASLARDVSGLGALARKLPAAPGPVGAQPGGKQATP